MWGVCRPTAVCADCQGEALNLPTFGAVRREYFEEHRDVYEKGNAHGNVVSAATAQCDWTFRITQRYVWEMRKPAPALMPIFRSQHQAEMLAWLYLRPGHEFTLSDLARRLSVSPGVLHAEVKRLVDAGLLLSRTVGRSRLLQANTNSRASRALTELLTVSFGPEVVIADEFGPLDSVDAVAIYGSWARRYRGETGRAPVDVDIMVVGRPEREEVYKAAERAEERLGMPVNPVVRSLDAWREGTDSLVMTAKRDAVTVVERDGDAV